MDALGRGRGYVVVPVLVPDLVNFIVPLEV